MIFLHRIIISILSFSIFTLLSCGESQPKKIKPIAEAIPEGTLKMSAILKTIADTSSPNSNFFLNSKRAESLLKQIQNSSFEKRVGLQATYAYELLQSGKTIEAITELESFIKTLDSLKVPVGKKFYSLLGVAYLRLGEQQNCCSNHTSESCIIPIKGSGIHKMDQGSKKAIEIYEKILSLDPNDLQARWLLNIAYMTIGKYPDQVPQKYLVPLEDSKAEKNFPHFKDVAPFAGVDGLGLLGGTCVEDFDKDGFLDIMCCSQGLSDPLKFFHNNGDGSFSDVTDKGGIKGIVGGCNMIHADYNNDGWADVFIVRGGWMRAGGKIPNSLLKNNGDGTFEDVTIASGLLSFHPSQTAAWADFNNDGFVDLFIGNESDADRVHPCEFYMNNKNGTFTDIAEKMNMNVVGFVKGVSWGDINNDGLPDLYCSLLGMKNKLYLNKGGTGLADWKFEEIAKSAGVEEPNFSFPCWFFDFNNDGWEDIFVSGYNLDRLNLLGYDAANEYLGNNPLASTPHIYVNNKNNTFTDVTDATGFKKRVCYTMGSNFGDLDNDGWLDFYIGTGSPDYQGIVPNRMFHNINGNYFNEVTYSGGFGHIQKGHGVGWGDFDNDGDQDIYTVIGGAVEGDVFTNALFENPGNGNKWIVLQMEGSKSNKYAIGARIKISVTDIENKERFIYVTSTTGGSFGSSSLQQEIGLGNAQKINSIEITFPGVNVTPEIFNVVELNKCYRIVQGKGKIDEVTRKQFSFKGL